MWILEGVGLAVGVWFFLVFLDWIGDIGSGFTEEQARRQTRRWLEHKRPPESTRARR